MSESYRLVMTDDGGCEHVADFDHRPSKSDIREEATDWATDGDWGDDGATVSVYWRLYDLEADPDCEDEIALGSVAVEIEPNHEPLIARATRNERDRSCGDSPDDHDWTSEGEGGCTENPGVWSVGGTAMVFRSHCRSCGLSRRECTTGSQRNPGDHDTVEYTMPEHWCEECQSDECDCTSDDSE